MSDGVFNQEATIRFKRNIEKVSESVTASPLTSVNSSNSVSASDACVVEFKEPQSLVDEASNTNRSSITRTGDLSVTCSVVCSTQDMTATGGIDFDARPPVESSRLFFLRGVTSVVCPVSVIDDAIHEGDEDFLLTLSQAQIEYVDATGSRSVPATIGDRSQQTVRIRDAEDVTCVQFNQSAYRPSSSDADTSDAGVVSLLVKRTGDLHLPSQVTVVPKDGSAKEGKDYTLVTPRLHFAPGDANAWLQLTFLLTPIWTKSFSLILSADQLVNAQLGVVSTTTVFIPPSVSSGPVILPAEPIVVSLMHYGDLLLVSDIHHINVTIFYYYHYYFIRINILVIIQAKALITERFRRAIRSFASHLAIQNIRNTI